MSSQPNHCYYFDAFHSTHSTLHTYPAFLHTQTQPDFSGIQNVFVFFICRFSLLRLCCCCWLVFHLHFSTVVNYVFSGFSSTSIHSGKKSLFIKCLFTCMYVWSSQQYWDAINVSVSKLHNRYCKRPKASHTTTMRWVLFVFFFELFSLFLLIVFTSNFILPCAFPSLYS